MEDNEEEVCNCTVQPYSTMPTLLELQQMINRLTVAQEGQELMRWNSSITGVELKKISLELQAVYENFGRDMRRAFFLLARCRYFNQDFYRNVIESVKSASVHVQSSCTTFAGVKMLSFTPLEIPDTKVRKFPFLCRGGQVIKEAQQAWSNLLRSHIKMAELRTNFQAIEAAYRDSTKRLNIINQIVLPKTQATINYILVELEEITREESHRIRVISSKLRNSSNISYVPSGSNLTYFKPIKEKQDEEGINDLSSNVTSICDILQPGVNYYKVHFEPIKRRKVPTSKDISQVIDIYKPITEQKSRHRIDSLINFYEYVSTVIEPSLIEIPKQRMSLGDFDPSRDLLKIDKATYAMDGLLETCKITRNRLSTFTSNEKPCQVDSALLTVPLGQLKSHIDAVIQANSRLQSSAFISKGVKNFIKSCEDIDKDLKYAIKDIDYTPLDKDSKKRIQRLNSIIDDVIKMMTDYRSKGFLTASLEEFFKICSETRAKIGLCGVKHELKKIDYLKSYICHLESITSDITRDIVRTPSVQNFLMSCKSFREKLEEHKRRTKQPISQHTYKVIKSIKQKSDAETETFTLTDSAQQYISSCENIIRGFQRNESASKIIDNLYNNNIIHMTKLITNLQNQGLLSKSTIAFLSAKSKTHELDENSDLDLCSCQSDTCERFSELHNTLLANPYLQVYSTTATKDKQKVVEEKEEKIPETEVKEAEMERNVGKIGTVVAKVKKIVSKVKGIVVKENVAKAEEKAEIDQSKPTQFPSEIEDEGQSCACSFELTEISRTLCSSSCMQSDSSPFLESKDSMSSDSWMKPLLPKQYNCIMCYSPFSSDSSDMQVCDVCKKRHGREEMVRAMSKTTTT